MKLFLIKTTAAICGISAFAFSTPHAISPNMHANASTAPMYPSQDAAYQRNSANDYSFESEQFNSQQEIASLYNYYYVEDVHASDDYKQIPSNYLNLLNFITSGAGEQKRYMNNNNVSLSGLRVSHNELVNYSQQQKITYYQNLLNVKSLFAPSANTYNDCISMLTKVKGDASYNLSLTLQNLIDYLNLAQNLHYTKLEMLSDLDGGYSIDSIGSYSDPLHRSTSEHQGLGTGAAIQKLKDLTSNASRDIEAEAYPNPYYDNAYVNVYAAEISSVQVYVYDSNGNYIKTLYSQNRANAFTSIPWDGTDANGYALQDGYYTVIITLPDVGYRQSIRIQKNGGYQSPPIYVPPTQAQ